ncbi:MAG: PKD domain-containing protein [Flavobacteriales bacterium]
MTKLWTITGAVIALFLQTAHTQVQNPDLPFIGGSGQGFSSNTLFNQVCTSINAVSIYSGGQDQGISFGRLLLSECQSSSFITPFIGSAGDGYAHALLQDAECESVSQSNIFSGGLRSGFANFRRVYINCDGENSTILSVVPNEVCLGDSITITGTLLSNIVLVEFTGASTDAFLVLNDSLVMSVVPDGAQTGPVAVTGPNGTVSSFNNLLVISPPQATFDFEQISGLTYAFSAPLLPGTTYFWDFGDGNTAVENTPTHTYSTVGEFDVSLIMSNICAVDTFLATVNVINVGIAGFETPTVKLFPNPFRESFQLEVNGMVEKPLQINMWNMYGQLIYAQQVNGVRNLTLQIPTAHLASGVYLIQLSTEYYIKTLRAVKH